MELPAFEYHRPSSAEEAAALLARYGEDIDVVAGGTDLLPNYKNRLNNKGHVISLAGIPGLRECSSTRLGALTRLVEIERSDELSRTLPVLPQTARAISSPPLREHGTVGGNLMLDTRCYFFNQPPMWRQSKDFCLKAEGQTCLVVPASNDHCYATYCGELAAALIVLGADVELLGADGARTVRLADFFEDEGIVRFRDRKPGELIIGVDIPPDAQELRAGYDKLRIRDSIDFPSMGVAVGYKLDGAGALERLHVCTTALRSKPDCLDDALAGFLGQTISADLAARIGAACMKASVAYRNVPLDPKYRRKMVAVFVRRVLGRLDPRWTA
jgi:4-hydroxybenzoyl-CoA reductase subunit beta